ncbi:MAG: ribosome recycling factor [Bacteroidia bacterium]|nr:ribosome recycling factor [Bacteroidia bacterium]
MDEDVELILEMAKEAMENAIDHLKHELVKVRAGKAAPSMVSDLMVDYYGSPTPLKQVANVTAADSRTLSIQPWEKTMLAPIERAIFEANLGLTPMNDGEFVRINIPPLTEERRIGLVKQVKTYGEDTKISLRNARHKAMDGVKASVKDGYPEDIGKRKEDEIQNLTNSYSSKVDELLNAKEKEIMTV